METSTSFFFSSPPFSSASATFSSFPLPVPVPVPEPVEDVPLPFLRPSCFCRFRRGLSPSSPPPSSFSTSPSSFSPPISSFAQNAHGRQRALAGAESGGPLHFGDSTVHGRLRDVTRNPNKSYGDFGPRMRRAWSAILSLPTQYSTLTLEENHSSCDITVEGYSERGECGLDKFRLVDREAWRPPTNLFLIIAPAPLNSIFCNFISICLVPVGVWSPGRGETSLSKI